MGDQELTVGESAGTPGSLPHHHASVLVDLEDQPEDGQGIGGDAQ
jgi:hypothetical protein